jgi:hypothetical protein
MSSAHYFFRNYDIKQVLNLLCYVTEYPHTLTSTQKITRMYRYSLFHSAACSDEKNNGQSIKIGVIPRTTSRTLALLGKNSGLSFKYRKAQQFLGKHLNFTKKE